MSSYKSRFQDPPSLRVMNNANYQRNVFADPYPSSQRWSSDEPAFNMKINVNKNKPNNNIARSVGGSVWKNQVDASNLGKKSDTTVTDSTTTTTTTAVTPAKHKSFMTNEIWIAVGALIVILGLWYFLNG